ncbi:MAG: tyrosine-type recombinase/integrase [Bacteroides sp.]|nr:tyrosine-type recombinase/integrase [Bacteroides sp.]
MIENLINDIQQAMLDVLNNEQLAQLRKVLDFTFRNVDVTKKDTIDSSADNKSLTDSFLVAKRVEGCSDKSLAYYSSTIANALAKVSKPITYITIDDLRVYLNDYQQESGASKVTIDNIRQILSSFFSWLEDENYIVKSPVRRIHKVKVGKTVKETYTDESLEIMRDNCETVRDLALIDLLASTGMRVGELVKLNRDDIDFQNRECIVTGKGDKQRRVYFDARTKVQHLLGHQSLDTTLQYAMVNQNNVKISHQRYLG